MKKLWPYSIFNLRIVLFFVALTLSPAAIHAQYTYYGLTADYNSGIGERYTYGLGVHAELRACDNSNLYFNFHYSLGTNTHGEIYARGPVTLELYRRLNWPKYQSKHGKGSSLLLLVAPLICPIGITWYIPEKPKQQYRFGFYCNPLTMDYWNIDKGGVTSWSVESGVKLIRKLPGQKVFYISGGVLFTHNYRNSTRYDDQPLAGIQIGILGLDE